MNQLNSILIEGFVHAKARTGLTANNANVTEVGICSFRSYKAQDGYQKDITYVDIVTYGRLAEMCAELDKGREIRVVGRLRQDRWTDAKGEDHRELKIVAEHVELKPVPKSAQPESDNEEAPTNSETTV